MMNGPIDMSGERVNMPATDGLQVNPEAIEAAAKAAYINHSSEPGFDAEAAWNDMGGGSEDWERGQWESDIQAAMEAAAPYLLRDARAAELEAAADALDLPGSSAAGYYSSNNDSGYREAEAHAEIWLRARAAAIRDEQ